jgi:hypothetical protein
MAHELLDGFHPGAPAQTGRERITNDAEYLGLGAARCALFPSSMRFFVALDASSDHVTQQK